MAEGNDQKLQSELCWCIDQLKISLDSGKLNERQGTLGQFATVFLLSDTSFVFQ